MLGYVGSCPCALTYDVWHDQPAVVLCVLAGQGSFRDGGDGKDTVIKVPVGTIIRRKDAEVREGRVL